MHNSGMSYRFAHASTDAQDLGNQLAQLKAAECARIFQFIRRLSYTATRGQR